MRAWPCDVPCVRTAHDSTTARARGVWRSVVATQATPARQTRFELKGPNQITNTWHMVVRGLALIEAAAVVDLLEVRDDHLALLWFGSPEEHSRELVQ